MATFGQWTNNRGVYTQTGIPGQPLRPYQFKMGGVRVPNSYTFVDNNYIFGGGYPSNGCCGGSYNPWGGCNSSWNMFGGNMFGGGCCGGGGWMDSMPKWMQYTFGGLFGLGQVAQGAGALMAAINGPEEQPGGDIAEFADLVTLYGSDKKLSGCAKLDNGQYRCVYNGKVYTASSVDGLSNQIAEDINKGKDSASDDDLQAKLKAGNAVQAKGYSVSQNTDGSYEFKAPGTAHSVTYTLPSNSEQTVTINYEMGPDEEVQAVTVNGQSVAIDKSENFETSYFLNGKEVKIEVDEKGNITVKYDNKSVDTCTSSLPTSKTIDCDWECYAKANPAAYLAMFKDNKANGYNSETNTYTLYSPTGNEYITVSAKKGD